MASCCMLSYEILLTRIFAVSQWNHLFFLVISIALFGLAASGTVTALLSGQSIRWAEFLQDPRGPAALASFQAISTICSYIGLNALPLDYYRLALEPVQLAWLLVAYLILALPFFAAGMVISVAYAAQPEKSGAIYFATMIGSACGAVLAIGLTPLFGEPILVIFTTLLPITTLPFYLRSFTEASRSFLKISPPKLFVCIPGILVALVSVYLLFPTGRSFIEIHSSEYKGLNQALRFPDTRVIESHRRLLGHIDRVAGPYLRFAPGLSLHYQDRLPDQQVIFSDRDIPLTLYSSEPADLNFSRFSLSYAGYEYIDHVDRVWIILQNGGISLASALASAASDIKVAIRHPDLAQIVRRHYGLTVMTENPRTFLSHTPDHFDIIQIENWGSTIPGADALTQNHSLTIDAFEAYLQKLNPSGVLTISRRLMLPPADSLRLWATAHEALTRVGARNPADHIAILRNWDTYTLLVTRNPIVKADRLLNFANRYGFDTVFLSQATDKRANHFNVLPQPFYFQALKRLSNAYQKGRQATFFKNYLLDVAPQTDLRPFPGRMLKWTKISVLYKSIGSRLNSLFLSGEMVVAVTLLEALVVTALLLLVPLPFIGNRNETSRSGQSVYYFGIGCGFMLYEIYMIHFTSFLLGDAVLGFSVVITALLAYSGLGGLISRRWSLKPILLILPGLVLIGGLQFIGQAWQLDRMLKIDSSYRLVLVLLMMLPAGLLIGIPFPLGIRYMSSSAENRTYAWAINGCASVLSVILAAQLAISFGISSLLLGAMAAYAISITGAGRFFWSQPTVDNTKNHGNKI